VPYDPKAPCRYVTYGDSDEPAVPIQTAELRATIEELREDLQDLRQQHNALAADYASDLAASGREITDLREALHRLRHALVDAMPGRFSYYDLT
jgi:predicted RNase H-like nuclease (RuvC/YqgF family)